MRKIFSALKRCHRIIYSFSYIWLKKKILFCIPQLMCSFSRISVRPNITKTIHIGHKLEYKSLFFFARTWRMQSVFYPCFVCASKYFSKQIGPRICGKRYKHTFFMGYCYFCFFFYIILTTCTCTHIMNQYDIICNKIPYNIMYTSTAVLKITQYVPKCKHLCRLLFFILLPFVHMHMAIYYNTLYLLHLNRDIVSVSLYICTYYRFLFCSVVC